MGEGLMHAIQISATGGPEVLEYREIAAPEVGSGQLAVQVAAAGVNFIDIYHRQGVYPMDLPFVPGREGAGRVIAVGEGVSGFAVGDQVAWLMVPGSYAEATVGPAERFIPVPNGVSAEQAAAVTLQGLTAHALATDVHRIEPGDALLIHAGAGGVGLLLTQIAKAKGARVVTTVSTAAKAELSRAAGADEVLVGYDDFPSKVRDSPRPGVWTWCTTGSAGTRSTGRWRRFAAAASWCCSGRRAGRCRRSTSSDSTVAGR